MDRFRFRYHEILNDGGLFTYRSQTSIGDHVIIVRSGVVDIERGRVVLQEMNMTVDVFDSTAYEDFVHLPRITESELINWLRRHYY